MAVNPLVVFVGLSVTTVGGIVAVVQNKAPTAPVPASISAQQTPLVIPAKKVPATTKMASLPKQAPKLDHKAEQKTPPSPLVNQQADKKPAKSETTFTPAKPVIETPSFDMVRVEKDGGAVVVGKAAPGAKIVLRLNGKAIGKTTANAQGDWVFVPDQLIPQGSNELIVEATRAETGTGKDKKTVRSKQSIYISIPKSGKEKPLIVVSTPDAPTRVLQEPEAKQEPVKLAASKPVEKPEPTVTKAAEKKSDIQPDETDEKAKSPVTPVEQVAEKKPVKKLASLAKPETKIPVVVEKTKPAKITRLSFGTVDYNDKGGIVFTGKATAGATVRLYVDNTFAGDTVAGADGNWVFRGKGNIQPGEHKLRADQVTTTGKVTQRARVPFVRAKPKQIASLLKTREKPAAPAPAMKKLETTKQPVKTVTVEPVVSTDTAKVAPTKITDKEPRQKQANLSTNPVPPETPTKATDTKTVKQVSHVVIQPGNNLWNISRVIYGKGIAYTTIYQANQNQIKNPHQIFPGQIFTTPGTTSSGSIGPDLREPREGIKTAEN